MSSSASPKASNFPRFRCCKDAIRGNSNIVSGYQIYLNGGDLEKIVLPPLPLVSYMLKRKVGGPSSTYSRALPPTQLDLGPSPDKLKRPRRTLRPSADPDTTGDPPREAFMTTDAPMVRELLATPYPELTVVTQAVSPHENELDINPFYHGSPPIATREQLHQVHHVDAPPF